MNPIHVHSLYGISPWIILFVHYVHPEDKQCNRTDVYHSSCEWNAIEGKSVVWNLMLDLFVPNWVVNVCCFGCAPVSYVSMERRVRNGFQLFTEQSSLFPCTRNKGTNFRLISFCLKITKGQITSLHSSACARQNPSSLAPSIIEMLFFRSEDCSYPTLVYTTQWRYIVACFPDPG